MKMTYFAAVVVYMASAPLLFAEAPPQRGASTKERLLEAKLSAVVTVYEKAHVLKLEAELKRHLLSESSDKSDEAEVAALRKRIAALDVVIGKLRDTATQNEAVLLKFLVESSDAATEQQSVRLYKLHPSTRNITEGWYAVMLNKALESAGFKTLERHHVERGSEWLKVNATQDQWDIVERAMSSRHD